MTAKQLTDSILQLAIQGKLVPQDPNDEPASVLLDRIREEKKRLVKEGKLKKKDLVETPINEDEIPFDIPESWEWCRLKDILSLKSGESIKIRSLDNNSDYPVYGGNGINGTYDNFNVEAETLIIGRVGFYCGSVHKTNSRAWVTDNALIVTYTKDNIFVDYLRYALKYLNLSSTSNSTAQPVVSGKGIYPLLLPLPPLREQHRIVSTLDSIFPLLDDYCAANDELEKMNAELPEKLKKSILQEAIMGKLGTQDPNDEPASVLLDRIREEKKQLVKEGVLKKKDIVETDDIPYSVPNGWERVHLADIVNVEMGQSPDGNDVFEAETTDDAYEFHQGKICFSDKFIKPSGKWCKTPNRIANINSLLVCVRAPIGDVNITKRRIGIGRGLASINGYCGVSPDFLFYWMKAHKRNLEDKGTGSTFKAITVDVLKELPIPLPPLAEQHRIVEKIEALFAEVDHIKI